MAIKDKDGNVYILRGPNPLVKDRNDWDQSKVQLINVGEWQPIVVEDQKSSIKEFQENVIDISEELNLFEGPEPTKIIPPQDFIEEITEQKPEVEIRSEKTEFVINVDPKLARALKERGVQYFCAPVIGENKFEDDLYGSTYSTFKYGDKFLFDAIIVAQSDLQLQFWCVKEIFNNSIVYRKHQHGGERWWRITAVEQKTGGYMCLASVSDTNPDFT